MRYFKDEATETATAEFIRKRDEFLHKKLPPLYAREILPKYRTKCIQALVLFFHEDKETQNFWEDWCEAKSVSGEKAEQQIRFIKRKAKERLRIRKARGDPIRCCEWCAYNNQDNVDFGELLAI